MFTNYLEDLRLSGKNSAMQWGRIGLTEGNIIEIAQKIETEWPGVSSVDFSGHPTREEWRFSIHLDPFSKNAQTAHWKLEDWIKEKFDLKGKKIIFFFLPGGELHHGEMDVYRRASHQQMEQCLKS